MKTIGIAGGSGFVGRHLSSLLERNGYQVIIFSRNPKKQQGNIRYHSWQPDRKTIDTAALSEVDAMINLAGAGVTEHRWTESYKKEILSSRVDATYFLIDQLQQHAPRCKTYIASSATGIYGPDRDGSIPFTETSPPWHDFLADVCRKWEAAAEEASKYYRTAIVRLGIVLGKEAGAFRELAAPMKFGIMPILGSGRQMVSWIHVTDVASIVMHLLEQETASGVYNAVTPEVVTHKVLMKTIAAEKGGIKIPAPAPGFVLKIILGESSIEVLKSCTASADKIISTGFRFHFPDIRSAVRNLIQN